MFQEHIRKLKTKTKSEKQNQITRHQYFVNDQLCLVFECPSVVNARENHVPVLGKLQ